MRGVNLRYERSVLAYRVVGCVLSGVSYGVSYRVVGCGLSWESFLAFLHQPNFLMVNFLMVLRGQLPSGWPRYPGGSLLVGLDILEAVFWLA